MQAMRHLPGAQEPAMSASSGDDRSSSPRDPPRDKLAPGERALHFPAYLLQFSRRAMACEFELTVNAGQYGDAGSPAMAALDPIDQLEAQLTVFRETSEVTDINRRAAHEPVTVEPRLFQLLETCLRLHRETDGAMDI